MKELPEMKHAMRISGSDGTIFEMSVVGYQYQGIQNEEYDSNWWRIWIHVVHPRGEWNSLDASLLTWGVKSLADWFDSIAKGDQVDVEHSFAEPNLSFRLLNREEHRKSLAIYFELESRPRWASSEHVPAEDLFIEFPLHELDLSQASAQLRRELARYPRR